jgi:CubicO group peptidase (beta-lactamase class C family)
MDFTKLTNYIDSLNKEYGIPATDCKITQNHEVTYRHLTGYSDYENKTPLTKDNLFRLFSATKVVTMTAILQQIERGNIRLYDEVRAYLPAFDQMKVIDEFKFEFPIQWPKSTDKCHYAHNSIRIIDLMTMTAGLSYDTDSEEIRTLREKSKNEASTREVVDVIANMPLAYEPRTRFSYSLCHDVLAAVIEIVTGQKFSNYLTENIFRPLGITDFYFHWEKNQVLYDRVCAIYMGVFGTDDIKPDDGSMTDGFVITSNYESGGAGLAATVDAYSVFIDALCNGGVGANGARILSEKSVQMFTVPYTTGQMSEDFAFTGKVGYDYGLGVRVLVDETVAKSPVGEFGWDGAAGAYVLVDTTHHISIFYAQHIAGFPKVYSEIHPKIRDIAYECMGY